MAFRDSRLWKMRPYVLKANLALVSEKQRVAIEQYFMTDFSMSEIARRLGITRQALKQRVDAGLLTLGLLGGFDRKQREPDAVVPKDPSFGGGVVDEERDGAV